MTTRRFLLLVFVAAFLVRLAAVVALRDLRQGPSARLGSDGIEYDHFGLQLSQGNGYVTPAGRPSAFRAPGFPFLLAGIHFLFHGDYRPVYLSFCLLGALAAAFTYLLAREVLPDSAARLAAVLVAVYPPHVYFSTEFASEVLFVPLLTLALWQVLVHLRTGSPAAIAVAGLAFGWAVLTRSFALLIPMVALAVLFWSRRRRLRSALLPAALLLLAVAACLFPWLLRNERVLGAPVLVATNGGSTFYGGNNDWVLSSLRHYGAWVTTRQLPGAAEDLIKPEVERDRSQWRRGFQWVRGHLAWMPLLIVAKYVRLWLPDFESRNRAYVLLQLVGTTPFLLLVFLGQLRMLRNRQWWTPGWLLVHGAGLATALTALVFWGSPRFRDANASLLMLYAAVACQPLLARFAPPRPRRA